MLSVLEEHEFPFPVKRIFWITNTQSLAFRGQHAHMDGWQFLIPISGHAIIKSFGPGLDRKRFDLRDKAYGLIVPPLHWLDIRITLSETNLLVLASNPYSENDYIRSWEEYEKLVSPVQ